MAWTLVTGGGKRLGAEICRTLAKQGYSVVVHYNTSAEDAHAVVKECRAYGVEADCIQGDFSTPQSTEEFIARYLQKFHMTAHLINNVGNYLVKSGLHTATGEWTHLFQTNVHAPCALMQALAPSIIQQRGAIVNIGTVGVQSIAANMNATAYRASKQSLWMVTRSLAAELAPSHVSVNMVSPGYLDISVDLPQDVSRLPMHRPGTCSEVARVVAFLLDPASAYITGQNIEVAGGVAL